MDQESEEGKDKTSPDKQEKSPQVSEHVTRMGWPAHSWGPPMLLGAQGWRGHRGRLSL